MVVAQRPTRPWSPERDEVRSLLEVMLEDLPERLAHSLAVGERAENVNDALLPSVGVGWVKAGYLHDIGYAPSIRDTGLHQLDGARYLRFIGFDPDLCALVAHHSCAMCEITERGLADVVNEEFPAPSGDWVAALDFLTYCDMTTSPTGGLTTVEARLADIYSRYEPDSPVHRAISQADPTLRDIVSGVERRLAMIGQRVGAYFVDGHLNIAAILAAIPDYDDLGTDPWGGANLAPTPRD